MRFVNAVMALALLAPVPPSGAQEESVDGLIARLRQDPTDSKAIDEAISRLGKSSDPRAIPILRQVLQAATEKSYRQKLAFTLVLLGDKDDTAYDELARYAREAITSSAPLWVLYDSEGTAIPGRNPEFEAWCQANRLPLQDCMRQVSYYPMDVKFLAVAKDRRAIPLLRQALYVANHATVGMAIRGLAWLNDTEAIATIEDICGRLPPRLAAGLMSALAEFDDPRVEPLIRRFMPNQKWRQEVETARRQRQEKARQK